MLGIATVLMLSALDQTVIGNALPSITADLQGFDLYAWVATGYLLASVVTIPIFGRLGDAYGRKPFVMLAAAVFTVASAACAAAPTMLVLVLARAAQGIGGGMMIGTAFACIPELFPDTVRRLRWQMLLSAMFSIVNAFGPTLGGILTQYYGWRSVFYLNLPLGVLALWLVWRFLPRFRPPRDGRSKVDWLGAALIAIVLSTLQVAVQSMSRAGLDLAAGALLALCLAACVALVAWERIAVAPLLPAMLFQDAKLRTLFVLAVLAGAIMFILLFYMPVLFQGVYGYSPKDAGLLITPLVLCITLGAIVNGRIVTRVKRPSRLVRFGFAMLLLASLGLLTAGGRAPFAVLLALMFIAGVGFGFIYLNLTVFTQALAPRSHVGIATAMSQSLRLVGGMLGTAAVAAIVGAFYARGVDHAFRARGWGAATRFFADPKVLFPGAGATSAAPQAPAGLGAAADHAVLASPPSGAMLALARDALSHALWLGFVLTALLALLGLWQVGRLASFSLNAAPARAPNGD
ncbi:MFS transporter [Robbsia sp. Bb-Pol-6]|uniref:MFS transporter n=1 Tax=Robbsia betulipollinis TaxID=2981849 RepID=A0ABT3ZIT5_9BURK|nr:MFS transporter [Robbsia betulipollinis]MCY0385893.1 MFS transporter [Robbsia betulipollinis]